MRLPRHSLSLWPHTRAVTNTYPAAPRASSEAIRKTVIADIKAAAKEASPEALKALKDVIANEKAPGAARVGAAVAILDRGCGQPTQAVEANVNIFGQMTDDEQKTMLAALKALKGDWQSEPNFMPIGPATRWVSPTRTDAPECAKKR